MSAIGRFFRRSLSGVHPGITCKPSGASRPKIHQQQIRDVGEALLKRLFLPELTYDQRQRAFNGAIYGEHSVIARTLRLFAENRHHPLYRLANQYKSDASFRLLIVRENLQNSHTWGAILDHLNEQAALTRRINQALLMG